MTDASAEGLPVVVLDRNLWVISANRSFCRAFRVSRQDMRGRPLCLIGDGRSNVHALLTQLESFVRQNAVVGAYEWEADIVGVGRRTMQVTVRKFVCSQVSQNKIVAAFEDIADRWADMRTDAGKRRSCEVDHHALVSCRPV